MDDACASIRQPRGKKSVDVKKWGPWKKRHRYPTLTFSRPSPAKFRTFLTLTSEPSRVPLCISAKSPAATGWLPTSKGACESMCDVGKTSRVPQILLSSNKQRQKTWLMGLRTLRVYNTVQQRVGKGGSQQTLSRYSTNSFRSLGVRFWA